MSRSKPGMFAALVIGAMVMAACGSAATSGSGTGSAQSQPAAAKAPTAASGALTTKAFKIGLDMPETTTSRYETKDHPYFAAALKQYCPNCQLLYGNANSDASAQEQQAQSMLAEGANVLVVDPFDGVAAASIVAAAKAQHVPVVAYDRLIHSPDLTYIVSNDYEQVGKLQATAFVNGLKAEGASTSSGGVLMIDGAATDNNAHTIMSAALPIVQASGYQILNFTQTWDPTEANTWISGQITRFGHKIIGVYSANDNNANAAIAAFRAAGWTDKQIGSLELTGLDASVQGLQNILGGVQLMSTYNAFKLEANRAAEVAVDLALGKTPPSNGTVSGIPAFLNPPQAVTVSNIGSTVIKDGFWSVSDLCTPQLAQACTAAGLH